MRFDLHAHKLSNRNTKCEIKRHPSHRVLELTCREVVPVPLAPSKHEKEPVPDEETVLFIGSKGKGTNADCMVPFLAIGRCFETGGVARSIGLSVIIRRL